MSFYVQPKSAKAIYDMPFDEYKALPHINQSYLTTLLQKSPMHAEYERENPRNSTASMNLGTLAHSILFGEIDPYEDLIAIPRKTEAAVTAALLDTDRKNVQVVNKTEHAAAIAMYEATPQSVRNLLDGSDFEVTILFDLNVLDSDIVIPCKARIDILGKEVIRDFKTTSKGIDKRSFMRFIGDYYGDLQAAFYQKAVYALRGQELPFQWIVQEQSAPYDMAGYNASEDLLSDGMSWLNEAVRIYAECQESGKYKATWNGVFNDIDAPDWHKFQPELDDSGLERVASL